MSDDWKGEKLIRNMPKDEKEGYRLSNKLFHKRRREAGVPPAGMKKHKVFIATMKAHRKPETDE